MQRKTPITSTLLALCVALCSVTAAHAVPLRVGETARIDFDLTAQSVASSYDLIGYGLTFGDNTQPVSGQSLDDLFDAADSLVIRWFAADGTALSAERTISIPVLMNGSTAVGAGDGLSPRLSGEVGFGLVTVTAGAFDLTAARVNLQDRTNNGTGGPIIGTGVVEATVSAVPAVPLPASAMLLGGALFGFAALRRRTTRTLT